MSNEEIITEVDKGLETLKKGLSKMKQALSSANIAVGQAEAYNKGLEDAWELAKKIDIFDNEERTKIFGYLTSEYIKERYTIQEALAKLEAYEKEQNEIKVEVGDVVKLQGEMGTEFVVTNIFSSRNYISYNGIASDGKFVADARNVEKTGKHIDIQSVLQQIGGADD